MSARRARPRRRVRTTENVEPTAVQEEEPAGPWRDASDIYRAVRAACLGTLVKWDPAKNANRGGSWSEGYLRQPVGRQSITAETMLCVMPCSASAKTKVFVKAGWLTGVSLAESLPADNKLVKKWREAAAEAAAGAAAGAAAEAVVQSPVRWGAASIADLRSPVPGSPAGHGAPVPSSVRKSPIQVTESDLPCAGRA